MLARGQGSVRRAGRGQPRDSAAPTDQLGGGEASARAREVGARMAICRGAPPLLRASPRDAPGSYPRTASVCRRTPSSRTRSESCSPPRPRRQRSILSAQASARRPAVGPLRRRCAFSKHRGGVPRAPFACTICQIVLWTVCTSVRHLPPSAICIWGIFGPGNFLLPPHSPHPRIRRPMSERCRV